MSSNKDNIEYESMFLDDSGEQSEPTFFIFDKDHRVENFQDAAREILTCLKTKGPIESLKYLSDPTKEFSAEYTTKFNRKRSEPLSAILFTTTKGGKGSKWKLDSRSLQHMLYTGDKYGIEGANDTKGTYHAHALQPLINHLVHKKLITKGVLKPIKK
jgi:hypothetical protein